MASGVSPGAGSSGALIKFSQDRSRGSWERGARALVLVAFKAVGRAEECRRHVQPLSLSLCVFFTHFCRDGYFLDLPTRRAPSARFIVPADLPIDLLFFRRIFVVLLSRSRTPDTG